MEGGADFTVTRWRAGGAVVVAPEGEIDLVTTEALKAELDLARTECANVVLDLRAVSFIDSAGVRLVLETQREVHSAGGEFSVVKSPGAVQRVFDLVGLGDRVRLVDQPPA
jgi:anti-anti-sigma factor